ncbi:20668_t:CDS:2 [Gigaspora rosea]|nr:20668_t:CDS:2 [Gigaspora rosea]
MEQTKLKAQLLLKKKKSKNIKTKLTKCTSFSQSILALRTEDIEQVYNPLSDGNCGFRALAIAIRENEEN